MPDFTHTFRRLVSPLLRERCRVQGFFLALGESDFVEAHAAVMQLALTRGATFLPDDDLIALDEWIAVTLLRFCDAFAPAIAVQSQVADRIAIEAARYV